MMLKRINFWSAGAEVVGLWFSDRGEAEPGQGHNHRPDHGSETGRHYDRDA